MDDMRLGSALRSIRIRRGWRQEDVATKADASRWQVGRLERGRIEEVGIATARRVAGALDATIDVRLRWQGADLDRLVNANHSRMQERVVGLLGELGWTPVPEPSFSQFGERGFVDILAWHVGTRAVLVIELKTDIVNFGELVGIVDRKRRLAGRIARERGWTPAGVSVWVTVMDTRTNRRRVAAHQALLRAAFPSDGRTVRAWLQHPGQPIAALGFLTHEQQASTRRGIAGRRRVRRRVSPPVTGPVGRTSDVAVRHSSR
jgi:transcriptional regulator with XRE-family HTH domain